MSDTDSTEARRAKERRDVQCDLSPHKAARAAIWIFGAEYAAQSGGSMTFWDRLPQNKKQLARDVVRDIEKARAE